MHSLIYRLLLSLFMALMSIVSLTSNASANEGGAEGTVESSCIFYGVEPGELGVNGDNTVLKSSIGGKSATVELDCSGAATVTITKPEKTGGTGSTEFEVGNLSATASGNILSKTISDGESATVEVDSAGTIKVDMQASTGSTIKIAPGTYNFTVTITATP